MKINEKEAEDGPFLKKRNKDCFIRDGYPSNRRKLELNFLKM